MNEDRPSKTRRKKDMTRLQNVGESLVQLPLNRLSEFDIPDSLLQAIKDAKSISQHGAKRRQLQYIGKLMRQVDVAPIEEKLEHIKKPSNTDVRVLHQIEAWRDQLIKDPAAVDEFQQEFQSVDVKRLNELIALCAGDRTQKSRIAYRELFQFISAIVNTRNRGE